MELQEQTNAYIKDLRTVQMKLGMCQRDTKMNQVTSNHIATLSPDTKLYKAIGKAFLLSNRNDIETQLENEITKLTKNQRDYMDRKEYLERRITSNRTNMSEITGA